MHNSNFPFPGLIHLGRQVAEAFSNSLRIA